MFNTKKQSSIFVSIHPSIHQSPFFREKSIVKYKIHRTVEKENKKTAHQYQQRKKKKTTCTSYIDVFLEIPKVKACINHIVNASVREPKSPNYIMFPTFYNVTVFKLVCN